MPSIPWASSFRADNSIVLSVYPFGELLLSPPSLGESYFRADHLILHPLASYFNVYYITLHPSIPLASYFCAIHLLGDLSSCLPFKSPSFSELFFMPIIQLSTHPSLWRVIFESSIPWVSYLRAELNILQSLASYFRADHVTLHPSILLASYFCAIHLLGELFSCLPFNSPSFGELFFMPIIQLSTHPSLWRVIFVLSNPWASAYYLILHPLASYFRADYLTLHPSIPLASYFCTVQPLDELFSCLLFDSPSFGELFSC